METPIDIEDIFTDSSASNPIEIDLSEILLNVPIHSKSLYEDHEIWRQFSPIFGINVLSNTSVLESKIGLYPIAASTHLNIDLKPGLDLKLVTIYNTLGQTIKVSRKNKINVSNLSKGIYTVTIHTNKGNITKQIVIN